jgi:zinc-ribbon domain
MEPEIARRCLDCGASVRGNAVFCPQCGRQLKAGASSGIRSAAEAPDLPARRKTDAVLNASTIDLPESSPASASNIAAAEDAIELDTAGVSHQHAEVVSQNASLDDDGRSKRQRMTAAAREVVEEKLSPRVEKLRQASNVVLEEASYDPSLRFVLVAVVVLVLSLLLLLLNYLLG